MLENFRLRVLPVLGAMRGIDSLIYVYRSLHGLTPRRN